MDTGRTPGCFPIGEILPVPFPGNGASVSAGEGDAKKYRYRVEIFEAYREGLHLLETFSHIILLFVFHRSGEMALSVFPPKAQGQKTGVFATRSPRRPNHIGMTILELESINGGIITGVSKDELYVGTPVLDIKPYLPHLDNVPGATPGWLAH